LWLGEKNVPIDAIERIARTLKVDPAELSGNPERKLS
jgi:hypothetical protein